MNRTRDRSVVGDVCDQRISTTVSCRQADTPRALPAKKSNDGPALRRDLLIMESLASRGVPEVADLLKSGAQVLSDANLNHWLGHLPERGFEFDSRL